MTEERRVAVVTGANRGLGFETARQLAQRDIKVIVTSRDGLMGKAAADKLQSEGLDVAFQPLDVLRADAVIRLREFLENAFGRLDILINCAGTFPEIDDPDTGVLDADLDTLRRCLETNTFGSLRLIQELLPLMRPLDYGRVVNVSSGYARLSRMGRGYPGYRLSKAALNALTTMVAAETADENILVNAVDPGWARTRLGGAGATHSPESAAGAIVAAATLPDDGPRGRFLHHGEVLDW